MSGHRSGNRSKRRRFLRRGISFPVRPWGVGLGLLLLLCAPAAARDIRLGILPVVDTLPLRVAEEESLFEGEGLCVEIVSFQSALERDAALQAGRLDGYFGDLLNTLLLVRSGVDLRILTTAFHTRPDARMFGIAAAPGAGVQDLEALRGRSVAISRATVIEYLLDRILAAQGKEPGFVKKEEIKKMPIRLQMLLSGNVPAALLPEPLLTLAESRGATVVADDRVLDTALTVIALRLELLEGRPDLPERFLRAYGRALTWIGDHPKAAMELLTARTRFPPEMKGRYRLPGFPGVGAPSRRDVEEARAWIAQQGLAEGTPGYEEVVWSPERP